MPDSFTKNAQTIIVALIVGLFAWQGISTINGLEQRARADEKMVGLIDRMDRLDREVVPRSENERRYESLEKADDRMIMRIGKLEERSCKISDDGEAMSPLKVSGP